MKRTSWNMKNFFLRGGLGISGKTALITGVVTFVLLFVSSLAVLYFESRLVNEIIDEYTKDINGEIENHGRTEKIAIEERIKVKTQILASVSALPLYNVDLDALKNLLVPYMEFREIVAIMTFDADNNPFYAIWKNPEIMTGMEVPDGLKSEYILSDYETCVFEYYGSEENVGKVQLLFSDKYVINQIRRDKEASLEEIRSFKAGLTEKFGTTVLVQIMTMICTVIVLIATIIATLRFYATRPLSGVVKKLKEGIDSFATSSTRILSEGQSLAQDANIQAASIQEVSSSLEEMSAMTRQSAKNSGDANIFVKETEQIVRDANKSMKELTECMTEIGNANENTQKIVKAIDEIAFQTNLLALNAAVEAARAGESGAGFAVVAGEVRNLAIKAGEAVSESAELIRQTVEKVKNGLILVETTNSNYEKLTSSSARIGELIDGISVACGDQARSADQINNTVAGLDKITQQNAGSSENLVITSEKLNSENELMKENLNDIIILVEGESDLRNRHVSNFDSSRNLLEDVRTKKGTFLTALASIFSEKGI